MLTTRAVDNLARCIIVVRLAPSVFDLRLLSELSDIRGIHQNVAKLAYMVKGGLVDAS